MTAKAADNRRSNGQFGPGNRANPGGRPSLPDEFKAKGPDALMKLLDFTEHEDPRIALRATELVVERIFGRSPQPIEHDAAGDVLDIIAERVSKRVNGHTSK